MRGQNLLLALCKVGTEKCLLSRVCPKLTAYWHYRPHPEIRNILCILFVGITNLPR